MELVKLLLYCVAFIVAIKILSRITPRKRGTYTYTLNTGEGGDEWESINGKARKFQSYRKESSRYYLDENGYLRFRDSGRLVHRWVAERKLGRKLKAKEVVHHINGVKTDNRPENLQVFPNQEMHEQAHFGPAADMDGTNSTYGFSYTRNGNAYRGAWAGNGIYKFFVPDGMLRTYKNIKKVVRLFKRF